MIDFQHVAEHLVTGGTVGSMAYAGMRTRIAVVSRDLKNYRQETAAWRENTDKQLAAIIDKLIPNAR